MKGYSWITLLVCLAVLPSMVNAQGVPRKIPYQGRVLVQGTNWTGNATMKFVFVNPAGDTTYWSNDGTSIGGSEPTAGLQVMVDSGLYSLLLGDTNLVNMVGIPDNVFSFDIQLRVWFDDGGERVPVTFARPTSRCCCIFRYGGYVGGRNLRRQ